MSAENTTDSKQSRRRRRIMEEEAKAQGKIAEAAAEEVEEDDSEDDDDDSEVGLTTTQRGLTPKKGRPTPSRRKGSEEEEEGNVVVRGVGGLRGYFEDTMEELRKVTWPTREEIQRLTAVVLVVTTITSIILGAISLLFAELVRAGIENPVILVGTFAVAVVLVLGFLFYTSRSSGTSY